MDEPTTGLDPNQLEEIRGLIRALGKEKTVMLSTHIMQEVEAICDKVIIVNKGSIVANDVTRNLQRSSTRQLITVEFDRETSPELLKTIKDVDQVKFLGNHSWQLISLAKEDIRKEVFNFAVSQNLGVLTLNREEQRMEDVFKELTR
jgi:ABC-2 type transport system ATP-binding protein